jgi:hypothetical protein
MAQIIQNFGDESIVSGAVDENYHLILTKGDGSTIDAGYVRGQIGPTAGAEIHGLTEISGNLSDDDEMVVYDLSASVNKKSLISRIFAYVQGKFTGSASSVLTTSLPSGVAVVTDGGQKLSSSSTTATEIGYLHGVTSPLQAQIDSKGVLPNPDVQMFSAAGTWTKPEGMTSVLFELWGGGGAGGSADNANPNSNANGASGGGGGGYVSRIVSIDDLPETLDVVVGAGGVAALASNGGAGGTSSVWELQAGGGGGGGGYPTMAFWPGGGGSVYTGGTGFGVMESSPTGYSAGGGAGIWGPAATNGVGGPGGAEKGAPLTSGNTPSNSGSFGGGGGTSPASGAIMVSGGNSIFGGGGGGAASLIQSNQTIVAGSGGSSVYGGGGGGAPANMVGTTFTSTSGSGGSSVYGGGGGGAGIGQIQNPATYPSSHVIPGSGGTSKYGGAGGSGSVTTVLSPGYRCGGGGGGGYYDGADAVTNIGGGGGSGAVRITSYPYVVRDAMPAIGLP